MSTGFGNPQSHNRPTSNFVWLQAPSAPVDVRELKVGHFCLASCWIGAGKPVELGLNPS